jgi:hypoxanthine phosphoribosyltransferase
MGQAGLCGAPETTSSLALRVRFPRWRVGLVWRTLSVMHREASRILIGRDRLAQRIGEMGGEITADLSRELLRAGAGDERVVLVPILTGAMVFVADLIRHMPIKMSIRPVTLSSYPGTAVESQGVTLRGDIPTDLTGAHVLIVDDILDSGRTLGLLKRMIAAQRPASVRIAVLLDKKKARDEDVKVEYAGFEIEDEFVVGYGLDFDGYYRNLPDVMVLEEAGADGGGNVAGDRRA